MQSSWRIPGWWDEDGFCRKYFSHAGCSAGCSNQPHQREIRLRAGPAGLYTCLRSVRPFATLNIPATVSEAPHIRDALLVLEAGRKITGLMKMWSETGRRLELRPALHPRGHIHRGGG